MILRDGGVLVDILWRGSRRIWGRVLEEVETRWRDFYLYDTAGLEYQPAKSLV